MTKLILDAPLRAKLQNLDEFVEICDESGRILGYYHPVRAAGSVDAEVKSPFTDEEIERRRQQRTGRPLAQILERLQS